MQTALKQQVEAYLQTQFRKAAKEIRGAPCESQEDKSRERVRSQIPAPPGIFNVLSYFFFVKPFKSGFISPSLGDYTGCLVPYTEKKADLTLRLPRPDIRDMMLPVDLATMV